MLRPKVLYFKISLKDGLHGHYLTEEGDSTSMIQPGRQHHQKVVEQQGFKLQIKMDCFIIQLHISHLREGNKIIYQFYRPTHSTLEDFPHVPPHFISFK